MPYKNKDEQREYQRLWMQERRAAFFRDKQCAMCGSTENMQLDHKDRTQKVSHNIWSWSQVRREHELAKCQVLCDECHKNKTYSGELFYRRKTGPDGTAWCTTCKKFLSVEQFHKDNSSWNGKQSHCIPCHRAIKKQVVNSEEKKLAGAGYV